MSQTINKEKSQVLEKGLWGMSKPMLLEQFLLLTVPIADTFFLSQLSDAAAGGVGIITPFIYLCAGILFSLNMGCSSVTGQYFGADTYEKGRATLAASLWILAGTSLIISSTLFFSTSALTTLLGLTHDVKANANLYLPIIAWMISLWGLRIFYQTVLTVYGHPKWNLISTVIMTTLNIVLNAIVVFGLFGFPKLGVIGVAWASVISSCVAFLFLAFIVHFKFKIHIPVFTTLRQSRELAKPVLRIGIPSAFEPISFDLNMIVLNIMVAKLGAVAIAARVYTFNTFMVCMVVSISLSFATQAIVAQLMGKKDYAHAHQQLIRSAFYGILGSGGIALLIFSLHNPIINLLSDDIAVIDLAFGLFLLALLSEPGRAINIIIAGALRATGDAWFATASAVSITWLVAIPLAYVFTFIFDWGLYGILLAVIADETIRGIINFWRWQTGKWQQYGI